VHLSGTTASFIGILVSIRRARWLGNGRAHHTGEHRTNPRSGVWPQAVIFPVRLVSQDMWGTKVRTRFD
jgi:hypothetical protein